MASTEQEYEGHVRRMAAELNEDNVDAFDEILAPDWVIHWIRDQSKGTREEYKASLRDPWEEHGAWTHPVKDIYVNVDDDAIVERTHYAGSGVMGSQRVKRWSI